METIKLIALYYLICDCYTTELQYHCQRHSNNNSPKFTDQECLTIYLYCMLEEEKYKVKSIHNYAQRYLKDWFPDLPSYSAMNYRLNYLSNVWPILIQFLQARIPMTGVDLDISMVDSMPIFTCSAKRAGKVAPNLVSKGYNSTKQKHYYGVKLHVMGFNQDQQLPVPEYMLISNASTHDLSAFRQIAPELSNRKVFADKAYLDQELIEHLRVHQNVHVFAPPKQHRGQSQWEKEFEEANSRAVGRVVSSIRQPIESFFNFLQEKTQIQDASKVRSDKGLLTHIFARIAVAMIAYFPIFNP